TSTELPRLEPESNASANSAISAYSLGVRLPGTMFIIAQKAANVNRGNRIFFTKFCGDFAALCARQIWYNKGILIVWKEKLILFNVILFLAGAALMLVMGVRATRAR